MLVFVDCFKAPPLKIRIFPNVMMVYKYTDTYQTLSFTFFKENIYTY